MTTKGWEICVLWKDGLADWIALKGLEQSYPIELADFAQLHGIHEEAGFSWWIPYMERKIKVMISKLKSKYWQITHKYGINIPKSLTEVYDGNKLWIDVIIE